jgi:hypothetical protein
LLFLILRKENLLEIKPEDDYDDEPQNPEKLSKFTKMIPWIMGGSNFISGTSSGLTSTFFPVYFVKVHDLSPAVTQAIMAGMLIAVGLAAVLAQQISVRIGR